MAGQVSSQCSLNHAFAAPSLICRSNYFHPLGFAYFPDGAHNGVDELEPGIGLGTDTSCVNSLTCPAPMYFLNGVYLGSYSNIDEVAPISTGVADFGLDAYEPMFFRELNCLLGCIVTCLCVDISMPSKSFCSSLSHCLDRSLAPVG
jgi:hypothetical protein